MNQTKKIRELEKRIKTLEGKPIHKAKEYGHITTFFLMIFVSWILIIYYVVMLIVRNVKVIMLTREEKRKLKKYYIKGAFNELQYVSGGLSDNI